MNVSESILAKLYGNDKQILDRQLLRYKFAEGEFRKRFNHTDYQFFSSPGRVEISGNHTDHNNGKVLAAAVSADTIAVGGPNNSNRISLYSQNYDQLYTVNLENLQPQKEEAGGSQAIIRGIASRFKEGGHHIGGFDAYLSSSVYSGSGLSSSASFEIIIGVILNRLFNNNSIPGMELAKIGQYAENTYFGKPCGLMDQLACVSGGILYIDFKNSDELKIRQIEFDLDAENFSLLILNTGGSHEELTSAYAAIPEEMKKVSKALGKNLLRECRYEDFISAIPDIRLNTGDRAILRAYHFFKENNRVDQQYEALTNGEFLHFVNLVNESGRSSIEFLQNIHVDGRPDQQGLSLALALSRDFIERNNSGACRIHGGGFAGTIMLMLPRNLIEEYNKIMAPHFGDDCVSVLQIRQYGGVSVNDLI